MSDNDSIRCGDVRKLAEWFETEDGEVLAVDMDDVDDIPAAPHEMTAREFFPKWFEICNTYLPDDCYHCPLYLRRNSRKFTPPCMHLMMTDSEQAVAIVEAWAREHPEERSEE